MRSETVVGVRGIAVIGTAVGLAGLAMDATAVAMATSIMLGRSTPGTFFVWRFISVRFRRGCRLLDDLQVAV